MSKNILITGGAGFIGHHVIEQVLQDTDWNIVTLDRLDSSGNLNRLQDILMDQTRRARVKFLFHDLKAPINQQLMRQIGAVDYIAHLAAGSHVDRSIESPMDFVMDNVVGTVNLLDFARNMPNLKRFVYFSTDEVFGPAPVGVSYSEHDRFNPTNPYSASKAAGEEMCVAYENTYKLPIIITHTMNVYGERQDPEKFIPMCIHKIQQGEIIEIHADETKSKPGSRFYIHAKDVADALLFLLHREHHYQTDERGSRVCPKYNVVGPQEVDNLSLARLIAEIQGRPLHHVMIDFHGSRPGHDLRYALDGSRMDLMGWRPSRLLADNLPDLIQWTLRNEDWLGS